MQRDLVHLVLVGGGHSHLAVLRAFAMRPEPGVRITLIAREWHTPYSGMLPGLITGTYGFDTGHIDLSPLSQAAGARLIAGEVIALNAADRVLQLQDGRSQRYDWLSINCGITPDMSGLLAGREWVLPVKPIGQFLARWRCVQRTIRERVAAGGEPRVLIAGGGVGGIEIALAVRAALRALPVRVAIVDSHAVIGATLPLRARTRLTDALVAAGIEVIAGETINRVEPGVAIARSQRRIDADHVLWVTSGLAPSWLTNSDLSTAADGFAMVQPTLRSVSHERVFVAGDAANVIGAPRPKAGVFAVRQGPILAANLRHALLEEPLRVYQPQRRFLALISLANGSAIGVRGQWTQGAPWLWRWKDWIDRRFVARFDFSPRANTAVTAAASMPAARSQPSRLPQARAEQTVMHCAGCAAKLGADVLNRALASVPNTSASGVLLGLAERDDAAVLAGDPRPLAITVDGFRALVSDPYEFGALAMNHALGDAFAMGAAPAGVLAMITVAHAASALQESDLSSVLIGAQQILAPLGVPLIGGHSAEGAELSVGFTVVAHVPHQGWLGKRGLVCGDALVLTKPLGVGVLFAAQMRGAARSRWLRAAIASMRQTLAAAAVVLRAAGARGCTDVTGFGLLGHAREMAQASDVGLELWLAQLPFYDGALELMAGGISSSLQPSNEQALTDFELDHLTTDDPRVRLLVDPQTCGGLIAGVPRANVDQCVRELRQQGYAGAAVVGRVTSPRRDGLCGVVRC